MNKPRGQFTEYSLVTPVVISKYGHLVFYVVNSGIVLVVYIYLEVNSNVIAFYVIRHMISV